MAEPQDLRGAPPREVHIEKKPVNWLAWLLLALGILALIYGIIRHSGGSTAAAPVATAEPAAAPPAGPATPPVATQRVVLPGGEAIDVAPQTLNDDLQRFLASDEATPRTFTFDKLNFDTASAAITPDDRPTLTALGRILRAYPKAAVTLTGYADARGTDPANAKLGDERAKAVAAALAAEGVDAGRITVASGGDSNPVASNATAPGQAENRRTELTVTTK